MKQLKDNGIKELIRLVKNELKGYSKTNHTHSNYSLTTHNHDDKYLSVNVNNHNTKSVLFKFFYSADEFYDDFVMYFIEFRDFDYKIIKAVNTDFIKYPSSTNSITPVKPVLTKTNGTNFESTVNFNTEFAFINININRKGDLYDYHTQLINTNHDIINIHIKFLNNYKSDMEVIYDVNDYISHFAENN